MTSSARRHRSHRTQRQEQVPFWNDPSGIPFGMFLLSGVVLVAGLLLGGTGGWFGDSAVQLLALPLIVISSVEWSHRRLEVSDWAALGLLASMAILAIVQLAPIPMSIWSSLPAIVERLDGLRDAGTAPAWHSISLNPIATEQSLQWTLPAIAMLLSVRWMSMKQRTVMLMTLFVSTLVLMVVGLATNSASQNDAIATANEAIAKANIALDSVMSPTSAPAPTEPRSEFGFFSNRNHFATLLAMSIPLVVAMGLRIWTKRTEESTGKWIPWMWIVVLILFAFLVGMVQTHSRTALILGPLALVSSLLLLQRVGVNRTIVWSTAAVSLILLAVAIEAVGSDTVARFDNSADLSLRWHIHATTLEAARHFGVWGSGLGTFVQAYQQVKPVEGILPAYVNHAHSDYHELWLETGVPGVAVVLFFFIWFGHATWRAWRPGSRSAASMLISRAAAISIVMALMHSFLDYPLRKTAILVVFGMVCALISRSEEVKDSRRVAISRLQPQQQPREQTA